MPGSEGPDIEAVVETLVASHVDYAWEAWALPPDDRPGRLRTLYRAALRCIAVPLGEVATTRNCDSVAVWVPADAGDRLSPDAVQQLAAASSDAFGPRAGLVAEATGVIAAAAAPPARWYLATMGTRPERQRRGLGSAVLEPMLRNLDRRSESARLETSDQGNVAFYQRLGFEVAEELAQLPHGAPTTWVMFRPPRPRA